MIRGRAVIAFEADAAELRIDHDEILRESPVPEESTIAQGGELVCGVDEICQSADVTIRDEGVCGRERAQCLRTGQSRSIDHALPECWIGPGIHCESIQQLVEQRRIATGTCDEERIE